MTKANTKIINHCAPSAHANFIVKYQRIIKMKEYVHEQSVHFNNNIYNTINLKHEYEKVSTIYNQVTFRKILKW